MSYILPCGMLTLSISASGGDDDDDDDDEDVKFAAALRSIALITLSSESNFVPIGGSILTK